MIGTDNTGIDFQTLEALTGGRFGVFDVVCPLCGPYRKPHHRKEPKLRVWREKPDFVSFKCQHCQAEGYALRDGDRAKIDPEQIRRHRAEAERRDIADKRRRTGAARALWHRRRPAIGSPVETYLRTARAFHGPIPPTLAYLPAHGPHPPSMIAAFGIPAEPAPGTLSVDRMKVTDIHLTRLAPDGRGKAGTGRDKIMLGPSSGQPIVLASINDLLGLAITEGIEDGLSVFEANGLGVWAAGSAGRMPALAPIVPDWVDFITVVVDPDEAGEQGAAHLAMLLSQRGLHVEMKVLT